MCQQKFVNYVVHCYTFKTNYKFLPIYRVDALTTSLSLCITLILMQEAFWFLIFLSLFKFSITGDRSLLPNEMKISEITRLKSKTATSFEFYSCSVIYFLYFVKYIKNTINQNLKKIQEGCYLLLDTSILFLQNIFSP